MQGPGWPLNESVLGAGHWETKMLTPSSPVTGRVIPGKFLTSSASAAPCEKYQEHNTKKYETHLRLFFHPILKTISEVGCRAASTLLVRSTAPSSLQAGEWGGHSVQSPGSWCRVRGEWPWSQHFSARPFPPTPMQGPGSHRPPR